MKNPILLLLSLVFFSSFAVNAFAESSSSSTSSVSSVSSSSSSTSSVSSVSSSSSTSSVATSVSSSKTLSSSVSLISSRPKKSEQAPVGNNGKKQQVSGTCMSDVVTKRDTAIAGALQTLTVAIQTRGTSLAAAWQIADPKERKPLVKAAEEAFKGSWKAFKESRESAWKQFRTEAKVCKVNASDMGSPSTESGGL